MPIEPKMLKWGQAKRKRTGEYVTCPTCQKEFYLTPGRLKRGEKFCSHACRLASIPRIDKVCPVCGKTFNVLASTAHRYTVCSIECRHSDLRFSTCKRCGVVFQHSEKRYDRHYCSEECRRPPVMMSCRNCGKEFRRLPGDEDRQFCCFACYRKFNGETMPEKEVRLILQSNGIEFIQEAKMGRYSVDFILPSLRIALEIDGVYWHERTAKRDAAKDKYLFNRGWHVVRITDEELENAANQNSFVIERLNTVSNIKLACVQPTLL